MPTQSAIAAGANLILRAVVSSINLAMIFSRGDQATVRVGKPPSVASSSESREINEVSNSSIAEKLFCDASAKKSKLAALIKRAHRRDANTRLAMIFTIVLTDRAFVNELRGFAPSYSILPGYSVARLTMTDRRAKSQSLVYRELKAPRLPSLDCALHIGARYRL
jgi:hypothetical protein